MSNQTGKADPSGEVSGPNEHGPGPVDTEQNAAHQILALVDNYTERPDLLIDTLERHDPGFVRRMHAITEEEAAESRKERNRFGKFQAYLGLFASFIGAICIIAFIGLAVFLGSSFLTIIALGVVFAITQSGTAGFSRIIEAIVSHVRKGNGDNK